MLKLVVVCGWSTLRARPIVAFLDLSHRMHNDGLPFDDPLSFEEMAQSLSGCLVASIRIDRFVSSKTDLNDWANSRGMSILHIAASHGQQFAIIAFVKAGANPNATDSSGWTPLHHAVDFDWVVATQDGGLPTDLPTAAVLLQVGADDTLRDNQGETPSDFTSMVPGLYDEVRRKALSQKSSG